MLSKEDFRDAILDDERTKAVRDEFYGYIQGRTAPFEVVVKFKIKTRLWDNCAHNECEDCERRIDCLLEAQEEGYADALSCLEAEPDHPAWDMLYRLYLKSITK